ncbi:MAG: ABC transporter substrate-binding protein [Cyanobacteria bacterium P01_D01_bin.105]
MTKKSELPALIAALLITLGILGVGGWWVMKNVIGNPSISGRPATETSNDGGSSSANSATANNTSTAAAPSNGQSILPSAVSPTKQAGLKALAERDYATAERELTATLAEQKNDPEALISLSNAKIADGEAYTIAAAIPANKEFLGPALEIMRGVAQAQREINEAGGINGIPLKILIAGDKGAAAESFQTASELVANETVLGVVGHYSSDMTLAAAEAYETGQLPVISPTSTAEKISEAGDYVFRTVPSDRLAAAALARYVLNELNKTKAAVFYTADSAYSRSVRTEFTTELLSNGGEVIADFNVTEAGFSAGQALQDAKGAGAEVIMLALTEATDSASLQILSVNQGELPAVGGDSLYDFDILDVGREDAIGLTVSVPWHILSYQQTPFVQASQVLWGAAVNWRTVTAYDATVTLAAAISQGGPTRQGIVEALSQSGFTVDGATNTVKFFPSGDRNQPSQLVTVTKKDGPGISGTGYDYEPKP